MLKRPKPTILILSGRYGEGHHQSALAIKKMITKIYPFYDVVIKDPHAITHPKIDHMSKQLFLFGVRRFPNVYHFFYQKTREPNSMSQFFKGMSRLGLKGLAQSIIDIEPAAIICTCPISCGMASLLKKYELIDIPIITAITDFTVHSYWIHDFIDHYIVGSQEVKNGLMNFGVEAREISVTGIPIDPKFSRTYDKEVLRMKYGLRSNVTTVLISGGGYGMIGNGGSIFEALEEIPQKLQIICVCGHNESLYHQLQKEKRTSRHVVRVEGYVNNMEELMAMSDLMITKAGGLTISEALCMNLPLLLYRSLGGQERDNSQFLLRKQSALIAYDEQDLVSHLINFVADDHLKKNMTLRIKKMQHKHATLEAVHTIFQLLSESYLHHA